MSFFGHEKDRPPEEPAKPRPVKAAPTMADRLVALGYRRDIAERVARFGGPQVLSSILNAGSWSRPKIYYRGANVAPKHYDPKGGGSDGRLYFSENENLALDYTGGPVERGGSEPGLLLEFQIPDDGSGSGFLGSPIRTMGRSGMTEFAIPDDRLFLTAVGVRHNWKRDSRGKVYGGEIEWLSYRQAVERGLIKELPN